MPARPPGLIPNRGAGARRVRPAAARTTYTLVGPLRWIDRDGDLAALLVRTANSAGRRLAGHTLTLDLRAARLSAADRNGDGRRDGLDLVPGEPVTVTARLPRRLEEPPATVPVRRLVTHGPLR